MSTGQKLIIIAVGLLLISGCAKEEVKQMGSLKLTSPSFGDNGNMPDRHSYRMNNVNPELDIEGVPREAKSLVLIVDDPDAPSETWDHWILFNIPVVNKIGEGSVPKGAVQGRNSFEENKYDGPAPPSGTHRYVFKLYALDAKLDLDKSAEKQDVERAMKGHVLTQTKLTGLYSKK